MIADCGLKNKSAITNPKSQIDLAETTGFEPAIVCTRLFESSVMATVSLRFLNKKRLERAIGFEPMMNGFADRRLCPLGYARLTISDFRLKKQFSNLEFEI